MARNRMPDAQAHVFEALERLKDEDVNMEVEIPRAKAVGELVQVLINSAKVEVDMVRATGAAPSGFIPSRAVDAYGSDLKRVGNG